jgi:hypothetical protein
MSSSLQGQRKSRNSVSKMQLGGDHLEEIGGGQRYVGECQISIPNASGSLCLSTASPADSKTSSDMSACATPDRSLFTFAPTLSGSFKKQLDSLVEGKPDCKEQNQGSRSRSTSECSLDSCGVLVAGNAEDEDGSCGELPTFFFCLVPEIRV